MVPCVAYNMFQTNSYDLEIPDPFPDSEYEAKLIIMYFTVA